MFIQPKYDLNESRLLWLDLETTGLNPQLHSILEASLIPAAPIRCGQCRFEYLVPKTPPLKFSFFVEC